MAYCKSLQAMLMAFVAIQVLSSSSAAWSNGGYSADPANPDYGTHDWIAEAALELQTRDVTFLKTAYHSQFLLGTEAPDNPEYIGDTSNHHVYYDSSGSVQDDVCADRASQIYSTALSYLRSDDNLSAAYDIGVLAHYISDPGVFGHTMGAYTDWGGEVHHSDYEDMFESMLATLSAPSGITLGNSSAYDATMALAQKVTFGSGSIKPNVWMDANYNWADPTFESSALASLNESVAAVAAVINHLVVEAFPGITPPPEPPKPPEPQVPGRPTGLAVAMVEDNVRVSWSRPASDGGSAITGYVVYRKAGSGEPANMAVVSETTFEWIDTSVEKGTSYTYWIAARNSVGSSPMSVEASITIPKPSNPSMIPIVISVVTAAIASLGGALLWRRRSQRRFPGN